MKSNLLLFIIAISALTIAGQSPSKILKRAEKAMGGAKALQGVGSWRKTGTIKRVSDGTGGKIIIQTARPNLYNLAFDVDGFEIESGFNGKSGWMRDSRSGMRTLTGDASVAFQAEAAFRTSLWLDAKMERSKITTGGRSDLPVKDQYLTSSGGSFPTQNPVRST